jgi:molybdopterin/thiamine biosynthesis adenylyltransferase
MVRIGPQYSGYFDVPESHSGILDRRITAMSASIYGLGHLGSWIARSLNALGMHKFTLQDFDTIEPRNLSGSIYTWGSVGSKKTQALSGFLSAESLLEPMKANALIDSHPNTIGYAVDMDGLGFVYQPFSDFYILATDNPESRTRIAKTIFKQWNMCGHTLMLQSIKPILIDTRSAGASLCDEYSS